MAHVFNSLSMLKMNRVMAAMRAMHDLPEPPEWDEEQAEIGLQTVSVASDSDSGRAAIRLCFLIYDVARLHRNAYDEFMKPLGINRMQWSVLAELSRRDGMAQTELASLLEAKKANAGVVVASLESSGWVERREDPQDRRRKRVYLVPPAHRIIRQMSVLAGQFGNRILGNLSETERSDLARSLAKIKDDLKQRMGPSGQAVDRHAALKIDRLSCRMAITALQMAMPGVSP